MESKKTPESFAKSLFEDSFRTKTVMENHFLFSGFDLGRELSFFLIQSIMKRMKASIDKEQRPIEVNDFFVAYTESLDFLNEVVQLVYGKNHDLSEDEIAL